jgi:hemoglobin
VAMADITNKEDIEKLMRHFYSNLLALPGMEPVFAGIDFEQHLPKIIHFWSFVLLDEEGYKTNVFDKHLSLPIKSAQFDEWLITFTSSVDELFEGEKARLAKQRAITLAYTFKSKWQALKGE